MITIQAIITGLLALGLILYFAGYIPIKSFLQHRRKQSTDSELKECGYCGNKNASKRCASCKKIYYCSRECQLNHWKNGHKQLCKLSNKNKNKTKKKKNNDKKEDFMKVLSAFSQLTPSNNNDDDSKFNEKELREEYKKLIDPNKLKRKFVTYYSFKLLGYNDNDIPIFDGEENSGDQEITMNEMIDSMIMTKRMLIRDPELKNEMKREIEKYKQSKLSQQ